MKALLDTAGCMMHCISTINKREIDYMDQSLTLDKYNRFARVYDLFHLPVEKIWFRGWRKEYLAPLKGKILEVGVGTGENIKYYNSEAEVIGIDFSEKMLKSAQKKLINSERNNITLIQMDAEKLNFKDNSFDYVITTFVFCSIPNPAKALAEIKRVLKPTGRLIMIEHVLSKNKIIALIEHIHNPITRFLMGVNINRDTKQNIINSGMKIVIDKPLALFDVFRLFVAKK